MSTSSDWYPIRGYNDESLVWVLVPMIFNIIYILLTIGFMVAAWILTRSKETRCIFFLLPAGLSLLGASKLFTVVHYCLYLTSADVYLTYPLVSAFFSALYPIGKVCMVEVVFSSLHYRLSVFTPGSLSTKVRNIIYFNRFLVVIMFGMAVTTISFVLKSGADTIELLKYHDYEVYSDSVRRYMGHWDRLLLAFNCYIMAFGIYFVCFSAYLLKRANKGLCPKGKIHILLYMVSPAVIVNGLFHVIIMSLILGGKLYFWSAVNLSHGIIDTVTLACIFGGIVWTGFKRENLANSPEGNFKQEWDSEEKSLQV